MSDDNIFDKDDSLDNLEDLEGIQGIQGNDTTNGRPYELNIFGNTYVTFGDFKSKVLGLPDDNNLVQSARHALLECTIPVYSRSSVDSARQIDTDIKQIDASVPDEENLDNFYLDKNQLMKYIQESDLPVDSVFEDDSLPPEDLATTQSSLQKTSPSTVLTYQDHYAPEKEQPTEASEADTVVYNPTRGYTRRRVEIVAAVTGILGLIAGSALTYLKINDHNNNLRAAYNRQLIKQRDSSKTEKSGIEKLLKAEKDDKEKLVKMYDALLVSNKGLETQNKDLNSRLTAFSKKYEGLESKHKDLDARYLRLDKDKSDTKDKELKRLQKEYAGLKTEYDLLKKQLKQQKEQNDQTFAGLEARLKESRSRLESEKESVASLEKKTIRLKSEIDDLSEKLKRSKDIKSLEHFRNAQVAVDWGLYNYALEEIDKAIQIDESNQVYQALKTDISSILKKDEK